MLFKRLFNKKAAPEPAKPVEKKKTKIHSSVMERAQVKPKKEVQPYQPPPGVVPADKLTALMAMDSTPYGYANNDVLCTMSFQGYAYLSQLAQQPEYRKMVSTIAEEMTRKFITLTSMGDDDKADRIEQLTQALEKYHVQDKLRTVIEHDGYFGRGQLYIDVKTPKGLLASADPVELETKLFLSNKKITKGSLIGFNPIEPIWTYPGMYNTFDPLSRDFYSPTYWYVMSKMIHGSRMINFVSREVPDILKPSYNFGGLALTQIAEPYVQNWLRTRDSVSDMIHSFSVSGVKTNMQATLYGNNTCKEENIFDRAVLFNRMRDNRGLMMLDKDTEEFFQFNTPLSGLDALQAQAQEQLSSISSIPLVKLLGITPSGLNASSDGEIRVFYDYIKSLQESLLRRPLKIMLDIIQLSEFGDIDPDISFEFESLFEMTDEQKANIRKVNADADSVLVSAGIIDGEDARARIVADPDSPYHAMELSDYDDDNPPQAEADLIQANNKDAQSSSA